MCLVVGLHMHGRRATGRHGSLRGRRRRGRRRGSAVDRRHRRRRSRGNRRHRCAALVRSYRLMLLRLRLRRHRCRVRCRQRLGRRRRGVGRGCRSARWVVAGGSGCTEGSHSGRGEQHCEADDDARGGRTHGRWMSVSNGTHWRSCSEPTALPVASTLLVRGGPPAARLVRLACTQLRRGRCSPSAIAKRLKMPA